MMYYNSYYEPHHFFSGFLGWFIIFIIILFLFKLVRGKHHMHWDKIGRDSAMDILRERYAKGEINHEEFEKKKKDLSS